METAEVRVVAMLGKRVGGCDGKILLDIARLSKCAL